MRAAEQYQQQRLTVHFVHRFVDNELLSGSGEPHQIFVNAFALTGASGFMVALIFALRYFFRINDLPEATRNLVIAGDCQLLILLTATITGLFTVLAWDALLPDQKDAHILGGLPVRPGVILRAKLTAAMIYFAVLQAAFQFFLLVIPPLSARGGWLAVLYHLGLQSLVLWGVALFVFFGAFAVQGLLVLLLPYRIFLVCSSMLQLAWLLASLSVTFLMPPLPSAMKGETPWAGWLPVAWFLDLWQSWSGRPVIFGRLPLTAPLWITLALVAIAIAAFSAGFRLVLRRVVEGRSASRSGPGFAARLLLGLLRRFVLREPREQAAFSFAGRTLFRHRNTRLMLAIYGGLALCWTLVGLMDAFHPGSKISNQPTALLLSIPLDFSFLLLLGMRVMFAMPVELPSNWLFRVLDRDGEKYYLRGVRKLMFLAGCVPLALLLMPGYVFLWGPGVTFRHTLLILLAGWLITEVLLRNFHKMPFACSWLPGKANLKVTLGAWVMLFTSLSWVVGTIEAAAVRTTQGTVKLAVVLLALIAWRVWQRTRKEQPKLTWEEQANPDLQLLGLEP